MDSKRIRASNSSLCLTSISRSDSGIVNIEASNAEGVTETQIKLNVKYAASIKKITDLVLVDIGKNAYLECQVDAYPVTQNVITWNHTLSNNTDDKNYTHPRIRITFEENRSFLIIYNVSREDSGFFTCTAYNGLGDPVSETATLLVKHKPIIDRSPLLTKSATESGEAGRLLCRAQGAPNVSFSWSREGQILRNDDKRRSKYVVEETAQLDPTTYQSALVINRVTSSDFGTYTCVARNDLGFESVAVNFTRVSRPDTPTTLKITAVNSTSVTLKWTPSFDGGLPQSFRIRFRRFGSSEPFLYSDVFPSNTTSFAITSLPSETEFTFSIMAYNSFGESDYTSDLVKARTHREENMLSNTEKVLSQVLSGRAGEVPRLVIIFVCLIGSSLLILNVALVICFVKRRNKIKRLKEEEQHDECNETKGPTSCNQMKTGTEMYAAGSGGSGGSGGSYEQTVTETSLSGSDEDNGSDFPAPPIGIPGLLPTPTHQTYLIDDNYCLGVGPAPSILWSTGMYSTEIPILTSDPHHQHHHHEQNQHQQHHHHHHLIDPQLLPRSLNGKYLSSHSLEFH